MKTKVQGAALADESEKRRTIVAIVTTRTPRQPIDNGQSTR
jgi:hypothetical protein